MDNGGMNMKGIFRYDEFTNKWKQICDLTEGYVDLDNI
jgi:hypothetical protein